MTISVVIPAYNCAATIQDTLDSVLRQTVLPDEVLVMDDGSTDETLGILKSYEPKITVLRQMNAGTGKARDALVEHAEGDLIAFLDNDDIWHPYYLEAQRGLFEQYDRAVAFFTGHTVFTGNGSYTWLADCMPVRSDPEVIPPLAFLKRYNATPGYFYPSFCCVPKRVLRRLGREPFRLRAAEDCYFFNRLALAGSVVSLESSLVAYRVRDGSPSADLLRWVGAVVHSYELLREDFQKVSDPAFLEAFRRVVASRRREHAKLLMTAHKTAEARQEIHSSLRESTNFASIAKSLALLSATYLPLQLQPTWPAVTRASMHSDSALAGFRG